MKVNKFLYLLLFLCLFLYILNILTKILSIFSKKDFDNVLKNLKIIKFSEFENIINNRNDLNNKCSLIYISKYESKHYFKFEKNDFYFFLKRISNKISHLSNCSNYKIYKFYQNEKFFGKYFSDLKSLKIFDYKNTLKFFIQEIKILNKIDFNFILIELTNNFNSFDWLFSNIKKKNFKNKQLFYFINLKYNLSLTDLSLLRNLEENSNFLITKSENEYFYLIRENGLSNKKIFFLNQYASNDSIDFSKNKNYLEYNLSISNFNKIYSKKILNKIICIYADFNIQLNGKIENNFALTMIGLIYKKMFLIVDIQKGVEYKNLEKKNYKELKIDLKKKKLIFDSVNFGFIIRIKEKNLQLTIFKVKNVYNTVGIFSYFLKTSTKKKSNILFMDQLINDNNILSHSSNSQKWSLFKKEYNLFRITSKDQEYNCVEMQGSFFDFLSFSILNRQIYINLLKYSKFKIYINLNNDLSIENIDLKRDLDVLLVDYLYKVQKKVKNYKCKSLLIFRSSWPMIMKKEEKKKKIFKKIKIIHHQPWEFHAFPIDWIKYIATEIDELWVPSKYNFETFKMNGVLGNKIHVIPYGTYLKKSNLNDNNLRKLSKKKFKFLTIGGLLSRKGIDLIIKAYLTLFKSYDNVSLIIHSIYGNDYQIKKIKKIISNPLSPEIVITQEKFSKIELENLIKNSNVYLSPYRSEGFGLTILEAMAAGIPPIITAYGPAVEFCPRKCCFYVKAKENNCFTSPCSNLSIYGYKTSYQPKWAEPDLNSLIFKMNQSYYSKKSFLKNLRIALVLRKTIVGKKLLIES